ncbi:MAG: carbohydrate ABC transporter permease [Synergistaceae bacterium]|nr:carbohydrate ABC transporter permease [Synergistaceae bacterium]
MNKLKSVFFTTLMLIVSAVALIPLYIMIIMGTHSTRDIFARINLIPGSYFIENCVTVLKSGYAVYYWNSFYIAVLTIVISVFISTITGYAFAKFTFPFKKLMFVFIIANMMVPPQLGLIAYVMQMKAMRLLDSHIPLIMVYAASTYGVFFMTQYLKKALPYEIIESARVEGASEWGIFFRIAIRFAVPCMSTLAIVVFMWSWNSYLLPLVLINKREAFTIPLGIATLGNYYRTDYGAQICGLMLGTIPLIVLFAVGSRFFVKGLTAGAVKG